MCFLVGSMSTDCIAKRHVPQEALSRVLRSVRRLHAPPPPNGGEDTDGCRAQLLSCLRWPEVKREGKAWSAGIRQALLSSRTCLPAQAEALPFLPRGVCVALIPSSSGGTGIKLGGRSVKPRSIPLPLDPKAMVLGLRPATAYT